LTGILLPETLVQKQRLVVTTDGQRTTGLVVNIILISYTPLR